MPRLRYAPSSRSFHGVPAAYEALARGSWACIFATIGNYVFRTDHMIETNPIHARIADLKDRVASLRGYL